MRFVARSALFADVRDGSAPDLIKAELSFFLMFWSRRPDLNG